MMLFKIPAPKLKTDSRDVEAFRTSTGMVQVLKSIDRVPGQGERLHVSVTGYTGYPSEHTIKEVLTRFFDDGIVDAHRQPSSKPPPRYVVHLFGDVPDESKGHSKG